MSNGIKTTFALPADATHETAGALYNFLTAHRRTPVIIDGSECRHVGGQLSQIMAAAVKTWSTEGIALTIVDPSDAIAEHLSILGLTEHVLAPGQGTKA